MKRQFIGLFLMTGFITMKASVTQVASFEYAPIICATQDMPSEFERIELHGDLMLNVGPNAIEAGEKDDEVYIQFNQSFGNVNIAIFNSNGQQVYSTMVDTSIQQVVIIPFTNTAVDTYTIELNQANRYAEGEFEKN